MEERGCEAGSDQFTDQAVNIRIATYNILNTKGNKAFWLFNSYLDRYDERESILKRNIYELNADIIGL